MAHFPVPEGQARRFQLAVIEHFGLDSEKVLDLDVAHVSGDPYARVTAHLVMPAQLAYDLFNASGSEGAPATLNEGDLRIDVYTTGLFDHPSVRVTHMPSGRTVTDDSTESSLVNKAKAMKVLEGMLNGADR